MLAECIPDKNILELLGNVIGSFSTSPALRAPSPYEGEGDTNIGLPLGNLTSQLFVNIYLNKFDQFVKHKLKARYYIRYADDFVILSEDKKLLENIINPIREFLRNKLKLELHPDKIFLKTVSSGVDFLGMVNFCDHRILRTKTKRRMLKKITKKRELSRKGLIFKESFRQSMESYKGVLRYCNGYGVAEEIEQISGL